MSVELDHILWAAPDLDAGSALIGRLTGVTPARGGSHPGFGTRNSLLSLGGIYLEIISPDPAQSLEGNRGGSIAALAEPGLATFAVRTTDLDAYAAAAARAGIRTRGPIEMGRTRPDGVRLDWACLYIEDTVFGEMIPFGIDWKASPHPAASTPTGATLREFTVHHPQADALARIYGEMGIEVAVRLAARPGFLAVLGTPRGEVVLTAS
ncbi:VOC family protein [Mesorhizobium sp. ES1-1]|uniref:VOC family protein n=1 Tax=Mesorhizobium sp. ES1-1 TaxID=2876629 RepID=UPI001CCEE981|nr:VOC family protein [Mesorhizobium sp. ES1-1]MBZ9676293.1 VOC family protein [Mesorhizobium sp. ES1-1]